jgi:hypothetical protein
MKPALVFLFILPAPLFAEQTIQFSKDHPKPGDQRGEILVRGFLSLDNGWSLVKNRVTILAWEDGKEVSKYEVPVSGGNFVGALGGLRAGARHNVLIEATIRREGETVTILSDPATSKAK